MPVVTSDLVHVEVSPDLGGGEIFVFTNGTFVSWGVQDAQVQVFMKNCIRGTAPVELFPAAEIESEDAEFTFDADESVIE